MALKTLEHSSCTSLSPERRRRMVAVARAMFLEKGYARTSMSMVAAKVGGSKTTLWRYFPSKEALFLAVAADLIGEYAGHTQSTLALHQPLDLSLRIFGCNLLSALTSPPITALMRIVTAEVRAMPGLGLQFHHQGMAKGWEALSRFLLQAQQRGLVRPEANCHRAAQHLIALLQSGCYQRHLLSDSGRPSRAEITGDVDAAVDAFCRAYASN